MRLEMPVQTARALVGPRAEYYLSKWANRSPEVKLLGFNWPAFLLGPIFMLKRRMCQLRQLLLRSIGNGTSQLNCADNEIGNGVRSERSTRGNRA